MENINEVISNYKLVCDTDDDNIYINNIFLKNEIDTTIKNDKYYYYLGAYYIVKIGDFEKGLKYLHEALPLCEDNGYILYYIGYYYEKCDNDIIKAIEYYKLGWRQNNTKSLFRLVELYKKLDDYDNMKKYLIDGCNNIYDNLFLLCKLDDDVYSGLKSNEYSKDDVENIIKFKLSTKIPFSVFLRFPDSMDDYHVYLYKHYYTYLVIVLEYRWLKNANNELLKETKLNSIGKKILEYM
jgi:tetratricopeptide (TPR) repeat protein